MKTMTRRSLAIVLAVMMVFSSMIMGAITANAAETVYFVNTDGWTGTIKAYTYSTETLGGWPGSAMTAVDATNGVYSIDAKSTTSNIIFNGTGGQTGDNNKVQVGKYYEPKTKAWYDSASAAITAAGSVVKADWYVAGQSDLCGTNWDATDASNAMTKQSDGTYVWEKTANKAGTFEYKVTSYAWGECFGKNGQNAKVTVDTAGSTVKITFTPKNDPTATVTAPTPTTAAPTTAAPTTAAPTTAAPTTAAPTTAAPTTAAPATTKTIYFTNADAWTTVNVYAYKMKSETEAVKLTGEWPGTAMTDAGKNEYQQQLVKADVDTSAEFVIFNDGTSEYKGAFDAEKNAYYWDGTKLVAYEYTVVEPTTAEPTTAEPTTVEPTTVEPTTAEPTTAEPTTVEPTTAEPTTAEPTAAPATTKTIYFTNADAWTTVNVYAYKMKSETEAVKLTGEWPGTAMTDAGKNEYQQQLVKADVDTSAEFVIFNDGTSEYKGAFDAEKNAYYWDGTKLVAYEYTVVEPTTAEPTTAEPTTVEPTTAEPTTVEPTTAEPTTQPAPVLADGFYLAGVDGHWTVDTISADLKFNANPGKEGEYVLNTTLKAGDGIKVVKVESNAIKAYYPDPGDNYTVTAEDAGAVTIYFSETYSVQWEKFGGYFYITPQAFDYTVTYNYNYDDEDLTVTKTVTAEAANIEDAIKANAPKVDNSVSDYAVGEIKKGEGNTYSVTLDATAKKYTVSLNGQPMDQEFAYMDKATVTSDKDAAFIIDGQVVGYGKSFTFFVVGDTDVTTDETKTIEDFASISKTATIAADGKVTVELLASAVVEKFDRMGVAFAKAEKTQAEIEAAVKAITSGTAASNKIAVHNSDVTEANESGQYQFIYAPYVTDGYSGKLYFYTFAVDTDGNVLVSAASEVDYANIGK